MFCTEQLPEHNQPEIEAVQDGQKIQCLMRPGVEAFIIHAAERYELILWTKWPKSLADQILAVIDPQQLISHRLYDYHCEEYVQVSVKLFSSFGRDMKRVVIVDQDARSWGLSLNNGIPIKPWINDYADNELSSTLAFIDSSLASARDVTPILRDKYQLSRKFGMLAPQSFGAALV